MSLPPELKAAFDTAVLDGDAATVQELIKRSDIQEYLASQYSPSNLQSMSIPLSLSRGVLKNHIEIVSHLLTIRCVFQSIAIQDHYLLKISLEMKNWGVVLVLLQHYSLNSIPEPLVTKALQVPTEHSASSAIHLTLLHYATRFARTYSDQSRLVRFIRTGIMSLAPQLKDQLDKAVEQGDAATVQTLMKNPSIMAYLALHTPSESSSPFIVAAQKGYLEILKTMLSIFDVLVNLEGLYFQLLRVAATHGKTEVFNYLLTLGYIKNKGLFYVKNNIASLYTGPFSLSAEYGHLEIMKLLLDIKGVYDIAHADDNKALIEASRYGHTDIVKLLLTIPAVYENATDDDNKAFRIASENDNKEVVELLLAIPDVYDNADAEDSEALQVSASFGNTEIVKRLLRIPHVLNAITANNHAALRDSMSNGHWDIALLLLQHYGSRSITFSLVAQALTVPRRHPLANSIKALLFERTVTVTETYATTSTAAKAFFAWIKFWKLSPWPQNKPIDNSSWCNYLYVQASQCTEPKQAAIILLSLNAMAVNHQRHIASENMAAGNESAMDASLVRMVAEHYTVQVESVFGVKFKELGEVEGVEKLIKEFILDKIIECATGDFKLSVSLRKKNILDGVEADVSWARGRFTAKDDIYQTAWRAYDPGAPTVEWENLLTAPSSELADKEVYSIAETGSDKVSLKASSDIIRKMTAHYFIVTMDQRLKPDECKAAQVAFVNAIAEIRRAHNKDATGEDSPSCFPGCFMRLYEVIKRNPYILKIKADLLIALKEVYINKLEKALTARFMTCDKAKAYCMYDALCMLSRDNAWDVISKPKKVHCISLMADEDDSYNSALLKERQAFIAEYLPVQDLFEKLQDVLINEHAIAMDESDLVLLQALVVDIGGGEAAPYIEIANKLRTEALDKAAEASSSLLRVTENVPQPSDDGPGPSNMTNPQFN